MRVWLVVVALALSLAGCATLQDQSPSQSQTDEFVRSSLEQHGV